MIFCENFVDVAPLIFGEQLYIFFLEKKLIFFFFSFVILSIPNLFE